MREPAEFKSYLDNLELAFHLALENAKEQESLEAVVILIEKIEEYYISVNETALSLRSDLSRNGTSEINSSEDDETE